MPSEKELRRYRVTAYMLDIDKGTAFKGSEQTELWQLALQLRDYGPVILAGGLTPSNVSEAIKIARPYAVDVSSGVETKPGKKAHNKMQNFVMAAFWALRRQVRARDADARLERAGICL
jgi:phosphoribosylanthranilate isomerase